MAFKTKTDYFGLAGTTGVEIVADNENKSAQTAEAMGSDGSVVASEVFGEQIAPSCDYKISAAVTVQADTWKLGAVTTTGGKTVALNNISISTSAGSETTMSASGEQVADGATPAACQSLYPLPALNLPPCHRAKILFGAFELSGTGCHLSSANYTASCDITKATKEGNPIAHDVSNGRIECQVEIVQTGSDAPTIAPGTGWKVASPLTITNPDADYPTYAATLVKYLAKPSATPAT